MANSSNSALQLTKSRVLHESLLKTLAETQGASASTIHGRLEKIMQQLYDVESSYSEPEDALPLDLGLDQIEDCQE